MHRRVKHILYLKLNNLLHNASFVTILNNLDMDVGLTVIR